jgi:hypothetical protein
MQPRVLIICERPAERDTIRVLVGTMGCQWMLASTTEEALAKLGREQASAVLLELPGANSNPDQIQRNLRELLMRFPGRVMILTDETPAAAVTELIAKYSIPFVQRGRLTTDLWPCLDSIVYPQMGLRRVTQVARLTLDTFLRPLPAGIRFLRPSTRQLLYETKSLTADISFERPHDSTRTSLLGQIMRTGEPRTPLSSVSVVLKGERRPLGLKMTNELGEFSFEFEGERRITLEIEVNPNEWVAIISPTLDWGAKEEHQIVGARGVEPPRMINGKLNERKGR